MGKATINREEQLKKNVRSLLLENKVDFHIN